MGSKAESFVHCLALHLEWGRNRLSSLAAEKDHFHCIPNTLPALQFPHSSRFISTSWMSEEAVKIRMEWIFQTRCFRRGCGELLPGGTERVVEPCSACLSHRPLPCPAGGCWSPSVLLQKEKGFTLVLVKCWTEVDFYRDGNECCLLILLLEFTASI